MTDKVRNAALAALGAAIVVIDSTSQALSMLADAAIVGLGYLTIKISQMGKK